MVSNKIIQQTWLPLDNSIPTREGICTWPPFFLQTIQSHSNTAPSIRQPSNLSGFVYAEGPGNGKAAGLLYPFFPTALIPKLTLSLLNFTVAVFTFPTGII